MSDLIERQGAIDIANDLRDCISVEGYWAWMERLTRLPSAQPQRKTGKWVSNGVEAFGVVEYWVCDQCHDQSKYRTNFCPSCGADMSGESDE